MQCACVILSCVACPTLKYFFHIISWQAWLKKVIGYKICFISTRFETYLILRIAELDIIINVHWSSCKCTLYSCQIKKNGIFCTDFGGKDFNYKHLIKIRPVGAELLHAYGRTNVTKIRVAFNNFAKAPRNCSRTRDTMFVITDKIKLQ